MHMHASTLETRDLRLVRALFETEGATRAAKQLHLSQSAVSHQLRNLEDRLAVELFRRDKRRLLITPAGRKLLELAEQVLGPMLKTELEIRRGTLTERPKLRVATQCYTSYHWLPQALLALGAAHPEVDLVLASEVLGDTRDPFEDERVDLALCVFPPKGGAFHREPLFNDEMLLAVPAQHRLAKKPHVTGSDLASETLIQTNVSSKARERVTKLLFGSAPPKVGRVLRLPVAEAVLDLVQAGLGVSILPGFSFASRVRRGDLGAVRLTRRGISRSWTGVYPKGTALDGPVRTLLDELKYHGPAR
jgi:LysR family transcriptional regulator for metE and metH